MPMRLRWMTALGAGVLMAAAACSAAQPTATTGRSSPAAEACGRPSPLATQYLAIARAGNSHLERDFDGLDGRDRNSLTGSRADLRDAAATERLFDHRLLHISWPAAIESVARRLVGLNELRATLTDRAARSASLRQLGQDRPALTAANGPVEEQVKTIRCQLGLPPPETS